MRSTIVLATLALLVPAVVFPQSATEPSDAVPRLVLPETEKDLGTVSKGEEASVAFRIRNEGQAPLEILSAIPAYGCTVAALDKEIPMDGSGTLRLALDTMALDGDTSTGVRLTTNDPHKPQVTVTVRVHVRSYLLASPGTARWIYTRGESTGTIGQTVAAHDGEEFEIAEIETPAPHIEADFRRARAEERIEDFSGPQWHVDLTLRQDASLGPITGAVRVRTTHPKQQTLDIPVSGFVRPVVHVTPPEGTFGTIELAHEPRPTRFVIHNFATEPMQIVKVEHSIPGVWTEVEAIDDGYKYELRLIFDPKEAVEGTFEETIVVRTDSARAPRVEIPVRGEIVLQSASGIPGR